MKTKINGIEIEGSVEEIRELLDLKIVKKPVEDIRKRYNYLFSDNKVDNKRKNKRYTKKEKSLIKQLLEQNKDYEYIAKQLNRPVGGIKYIASTIKIKKECSDKLKKILLERNKLGYEIHKKENIPYSEAIKKACFIIKHK